MDNQYLEQLIYETEERGGGLVLNLDQKPAVVVLSIDRYNDLVSQAQSSTSAILDQLTTMVKQSKKQAVESGKVLVTGGAGYIGGHLTRQLILAGYEVVVLDNISSGKRENLDPKAMFVEGDLGDEGLLKQLFSDHEFIAVFHMAASLEVEESVKEPAKYFQNNCLNTARLLQAMTEANVHNIIFSSTAAVYGEVEESPVSETSPLKPNNPYGSSKLLAERIIKYYCQYLGMKAVIFRYFNACGFDADAKILPTHSTHLIYNVIEVAKGAKPFLEVYGNDYPTFDGTCIRDYVHVLDIVLPHILALQKMDEVDKFEIYNIGTGHGYSVAQIATAASEVLNKIIPMEVGPRRAGDAVETVADNKKLLNKLGYSLKYSDLENIIRTSWIVGAEYT